MRGEVTIGQTTYRVARDTSTRQVSFPDRFLIVTEDGKHPLLVERNGRTRYLTYARKRAARSTVANLIRRGLPCKVLEW